MFLLNPFKRTRYLLHTTQAIATMGSSVLAGADRYNEAGRGRCVLVTLRGEEFSACIEPLTSNQSGTGTWTTHFVIAARGRVLPSQDGSVEITLGFQRPESAFQLGWRLLLYLGEVVVLASAFSAPVVFVLGLCFAIILAVVAVPWSIVTYLQAMHQAGKDWTDLLEVIRSSVHSHTVERA